MIPPLRQLIAHLIFAAQTRSLEHKSLVLPDLTCFLTRRKERRKVEIYKQMRLDKFLQVSRLVKRRTIANTLCSRGEIWVNGQVAKAGKTLSVGDVLRIPQRESRGGVTPPLPSIRIQDGQDFSEVLPTTQNPHLVRHEMWVEYEVVEIPSGNVSRARATTLYRQLLE